MKKTKTTDFSAEHLRFLAAIRVKRAIILGAQIGILVLGFSLWELLARVGAIDTFFMSCPSRILTAIGDLYRSGTLWLHVGTTLWECVLGFTISTVLGVLIAIAMWWSEYLRRIMDPYVVVLNSLPKIALGPIIIIWAGAGIKSIVAMAVLIAVIITVISASNSFLSTPADQIRLLRAMGASKLQILYKLVLPRSVPDMMALIKVNVGLSWVGTIMGEYLVSRAGLGHLIVYGGQVFKIDLVMAATIILCVLSAGMYFLVALAERLVVKHRR